MSRKRLLLLLFFLLLLTGFAYQYFVGGKQHYVRGMQLEMEGKYEEAAEKYRSAEFSNQRPIAREGVARCYYKLAKQLVERGEYEEAIEKYGIVVSDYGDTIYASEQYAIQICSEIVRYGSLEERERASILIAKACRGNADKLLPYLNNEETVTVYFALIKIGRKGTEEALIEALNKFGYKRMAEDYLNCGNKKLEDAARQWAEEHGYEVVTGRGLPRVVWGSGL